MTNPKPKMKKKKKKKVARINDESGLTLKEQLAVAEVKALNFEISAIGSNLQSMQEALKRASVEVQTLPNQIQLTQKQLEEKRRSGQAEYNSLKELLNCPEGKEIDLSTGQFTD